MTITAQPVSHPDAPQGIVPPTAHSAMPTFGLVIVGDEILSGRRKDGHIPKTIELLNARGLQLSYVHIVKDDRAKLTALYKQLMAQNDVVLSCGGIGATPDDHTRQAVAAAAGTDLQLHPVAASLIEQRARKIAAEKGEAFDINSPDNTHRLQMAVFAQGAQIIPNPYNQIAGFSVGHVHCMPGFPVMAHPMMEWVLDSFYSQWHSQADWVEQALILPNASEAVLTPLMQQIESQWPDVKVFSLPSVNHPVHGIHIELGVKGRQAAVAQAFTQLQKALNHMQQRFIVVEPKPNKELQIDL